jgi:hypothetical protein
MGAAECKDREGLGYNQFSVYGSGGGNQLSKKQPVSKQIANGLASFIMHKNRQARYSMAVVRCASFCSLRGGVLLLLADHCVAVGCAVVVRRPTDGAETGAGLIAMFRTRTAAAIPAALCAGVGRRRAGFPIAEIFFAATAAWAIESLSVAATKEIGNPGAIEGPEAIFNSVAATVAATGIAAAATGASAGA